MSSDDDRYKPKAPRRSGVKRNIAAEKWAAFQEEYKRLARKYGITSPPAAKKKTKKKAAKKRTATKK